MAQAKKKQTGRISKNEAIKHAGDWKPYENMGSQDKQEVLAQRALDAAKKKKR